MRVIISFISSVLLLIGLFFHNSAAAQEIILDDEEGLKIKEPAWIENARNKFNDGLDSVSQKLKNLNDRLNGGNEPTERQLQNSMQDFNREYDFELRRIDHKFEECIQSRYRDRLTCLNSMRNDQVQELERLCKIHINCDKSQSHQSVRRAMLQIREEQQKLKDEQRRIDNEVQLRKKIQLMRESMQSEDFQRALDKIIEEEKEKIQLQKNKWKSMRENMEPDDFELAKDKMIEEAKGYGQDALNQNKLSINSRNSLNSAGIEGQALKAVEASKSGFDRSIKSVGDGISQQMLNANSQPPVPSINMPPSPTRLPTPAGSYSNVPRNPAPLPQPLPASNPARVYNPSLPTNRQPQPTYQVPNNGETMVCVTPPCRR